MPADALTLELAKSREETDRLFRLIDDAELYSRPLPQRHRLIFYLGHLEAFDWNQIGHFLLGEPHVSDSLDRLFERGIDPEPGQLPNDQPSDWPSLAEARDYVQRVRERLDRVWEHATLEFRQIAVEHRWMHAETLTYQLHNLPHDRKLAPQGALVQAASALVEQSTVEIPAGTATLGMPRKGSYGWDNEFDELVRKVPAFAITRYKITNGEYLDFVNQGGEAPHFWEQRGNEWFYRGMFDSYPLPLDAPVYVTKNQAEAYAQWRGMDLPTEEQFHRAAYGTPEGLEREYPWGVALNGTVSRGNFDFQSWDPVSVTAHPESRSAFGVEQMVGNGWEWTKTPFAPFPGFEPRPNYPGYSADFFDDSHFVLKGASPRTAALLTRRSLRNWFRPDYPYVYATFRLVENR
jgi:formylglycine-generating enzyme required for sulfatase activity